MASIFEDDNFARQLLIADVTVAIESATNARDAARRAYKAVKKSARLLGMNPDIETIMRRNANGEYYVSFEAGPYQWAVAASLSHNNCKVLAEPHYSFDLCFSDI